MSMLMKKDFPEESAAMPAWRVAGVAFVGVSAVLSALMLPLMVWFLMDTVGGVAAGAVGAVLMAACMAVMAKIASKIVGKTNGKFGKCRPFMVIGSVLMLVSGSLIFWVTDKLPESAVLRGIFFAVFAILFTAGFAFEMSAVLVSRKCLPVDKKNRIIAVEVILSVAAVVCAVLAAVNSHSQDGFFTNAWNLLALAELVSAVIGIYCIAKRDIYVYYRESV